MNENSVYSSLLWEILQCHDELMQILRFLGNSAPDAFLSAGAIRNTVWSVLHDAEPFRCTEIDIVFYDEYDTHKFRAAHLQSLLQQQFPVYIWDVVNQAFVHEWYCLEDGSSIAQYSSLADALAGWPETATAVAVRLTENDELEIVAPFGLNDLFELKLHWNDRLVSHDVFLERMQSKRFLERWNKLKIVD